LQARVASGSEIDIPPRKTVWKLERHTVAKHVILRAYLNAWLPIMGIHCNGRLTLVDAFCCPGIYEDGEPGSRIVMLNAYLEHRLKDRIEAELIYLFIFVSGAGERSRDPRRTPVTLSRLWLRPELYGRAGTALSAAPCSCAASWLGDAPNWRR
jgi:hypothetical protein